VGERLPQVSRGTKGNSKSGIRNSKQKRTTAAQGERLGMLMLHDDAGRKYAYVPAEGLPDTKL